MTTASKLLAAFQIQALLLLLPSVSHAIIFLQRESSQLPRISRSSSATISSRRHRRRRHCQHRHNDPSPPLAGFLLQPPRRGHKRNTIQKVSLLTSTTTTTPHKSSPHHHHHPRDDHSPNNNSNVAPLSGTSSGFCYVPPYGMIRRSSSIVVMNSMSSSNNDDDSDFSSSSSLENTRLDRRSSTINNRNGGGGSRGGGDDDFYYNEPEDANFGIRNDGRRRMMMEGGGGGPMMPMRGGPPPPPHYSGPPFLPEYEDYPDDDPLFSGDGGNYWVNPKRNLDRYPNNNQRHSSFSNNPNTAPDDFAYSSSNRSSSSSNRSSSSVVPPSKQRRMDRMNSRININNDSSDATGLMNSVSANQGNARGGMAAMAGTVSVRDSPKSTGGGGGGGVVDRSTRRGGAGGGAMAGTMNGGDGGDGGGPFWETRRRMNDFEDGDYYDDEYYFDNDYYDDGEWEDEYGDGYRRDYGVPPPSRSRSSFRSGAPPPPRPIKQLYDKLFWFGFDPDVTRPTDRTMFGGTRGKFNALELLRDREERQDRRADFIARRSLRGKRVKDSVVQDFGNVEDWHARKNGSGKRLAGENIYEGEVLSEAERESMRRMQMREGVPPLPPRASSSRANGYDDYKYDTPYDDYEYDYPSYNVNVGVRDRVRDRVLERRRKSKARNSGSNRRDNSRRRDTRGGKGFGLFTIPELKRRQEAEEYDRYLGLGPSSDDDDDNYYDNDRDVGGRSRRRKGYAYKYSGDDDDEYYSPIVADYDVVDADRSYDNRGSRSKRATVVNSPRKRSWEERALEMDRVPPKGAAAWGPNGRASGGGMDAQSKAALDALSEIRKAKRYLEKKKDMVLDAEEEVVALKADASLYEKKLRNMRDGSKSDKIRMELGYIQRDVEDASRMLRLARAERDAALNIVDDIKAKHWALISEYEATQAFDEERIRDAGVYSENYGNDQRW